MSGLFNVCVDFSSDVEALLSNLWPFAPEEHFTALAKTLHVASLCQLLTISGRAHNQ